MLFSGGKAEVLSPFRSVILLIIKE